MAKGKLPAQMWNVIAKFSGSWRGLGSTAGFLEADPRVEEELTLFSAAGNEELTLFIEDLKTIQQSERRSLVVKNSFGDCWAKRVACLSRYILNGLVTARTSQHVAWPRAYFVHRGLKRLQSLHKAAYQSGGDSPSSVGPAATGAGHEALILFSDIGSVWCQLGSPTSCTSPEAQNVKEMVPFWLANVPDEP